MRVSRTILILTILSLPLTAMAAESFFVRTLGGPENDRVGASAMLGNLVFFGGVKDLTGLASKGLLLATTVNGDVIFERVFVDSGGAPVEITALVAGDGVLHVGGTIGSWPTSGKAFLMTLSVAGNVLSQTVFENDKQAFLRDIIVTQDGGLLVVGKLVVPPDTIGNGWVAKLDSTGAIEWQKDIGSGGDDSLNAAVERPEGGYLLAGGLGSSDNPFFTLRGWLLSLDAAGNLVWQQAFAAAAGDSFNNLLLTRKGITAFGTFCDFCFFRGDGWIVNTDLNGNLIDAQIIGDFNIQGFDEIIDVKPVAKGQGFIVLGTADTIIGPSQQIWSARFTNRGTLRWVRQVGGNGFEMAGTLTVLDSGSIVFGGFSVADLNQNVYIGKLDSAGRSPSTCDQIGPTTSPLRDDGGLTGHVKSGAIAVDASAVAAPGNLVVGTSPTTVDELLCFE